MLMLVQAQRFVNIVLLPHVRRDIRDNRRLHFALFQSLKKACYKPDAFYKVSKRFVLLGLTRSCHAACLSERMINMLQMFTADARRRCHT